MPHHARVSRACRRPRPRHKVVTRRSVGPPQRVSRRWGCAGRSRGGRWRRGGVVAGAPRHGGRRRSAVLHHDAASSCTPPTSFWGYFRRDARASALQKNRRKRRLSWMGVNPSWMRVQARATVRGRRRWWARARPPYE
jgi:hypothetical protein